MTAEQRALPSRRRLDQLAARYAIRRAWHGFILNRDLDSAASLSFYAALSLFPASLAIVSALGLVDTRGRAATIVLDIVDRLGKPDFHAAVDSALEQLTRIPNAGWALVLGVALTLWTVSGYATAFGRAMNNVYGVQEGRRLVKNRTLMFGVAAGLIVCYTAMGVIIAASPTVASAVVESLGWPSALPLVWSILKWPLLACLAIFTIAFLYYGTPNLERPRLRWLSVGASFTIVTWTIAAIAYGFYLSEFSGYDRIYGWLGIPIVTLLWLYISSLLLMLGVEVDAELTRAKQLLAGLPAEESIQVPLRDTSRNAILARRWSADIADGRRLRLLAEAVREHTAKHAQSPAP
jgi:membrane protein